MKTMRITAITLLFLLSHFITSAQLDYATIDNAVLKLGGLEKFNLATITDTVTSPWNSKDEKVRAIFTWIANNIALDAKAIKGADNRDVEPEKTIQKRKSTSLGFSLLFQEMCSQANIRCLSVDGYLKISTEDIDDMPDAASSSWNVVQLGTSPNEWYYIDAAQASGYLDSKKTVFTRSFSPQYFFADKTAFNLEHYPDNKAWLLGEGYPSIKTFYALPLIKPAAYDYRLFYPEPLAGKIKTKPGAPFHFSFKLKNSPDNPQVTVVLGEGLKIQKPLRVNIKQTGNEISFDFTFKKEDTYPVTILINDKPLLVYLVEISE